MLQQQRFLIRLLSALPFVLGNAFGFSPPAPLWVPGIDARRIEPEDVKQRAADVIMARSPQEEIPSSVSLVVEQSHSRPGVRPGVPAEHPKQQAFQRPTTGLQARAATFLHAKEEHKAKDNVVGAKRDGSDAAESTEELTEAKASQQFKTSSTPLEKKCSALANSTYKHPGGVSQTAKYCTKRIAELMETEIQSGYELIDDVHQPPLTRIRVTPFEQWNGTYESPPGWHRFSAKQKIMFGRAEWVLPPSDKRRENKDFVVMIHGGDAIESALHHNYQGWSDNFAVITGLPVFAMDFDQEPLVPWPQNIRSVLQYIEYARKNGPEGPWQAQRVFLLGDSEGALTTLHTALALFDENFRMEMGFGASLSNPSSWLGGMVLSSPVVDVMCETHSMNYNCYDKDKDTGDVDVGNWEGCAELPWADKLGWCQYTYLRYFFGWGADWDMTNKEAAEEFERRKDFFQQPILNIFFAKLSAFLPTYIIAGTRDYYHSDEPKLANKLCMDGVPVEIFTAEGMWHDWFMYSNGCGPKGTVGPHGPLPEAEVVKSQITHFVKRYGSPDLHLNPFGQS